MASPEFKLVPLAVYGLARTVQAAFAGVPPVELLVVVQPLGPVVAPVVAKLKFSDGRAIGITILDEDVKLMEDPAQTDVFEAEAVTTGAFTTTTETVAVTEHPPVAMV